MKKSYTFAVLVLVLFPYLFFAQTQTAATTEYVCPPCGCGSDDKIFKEAGSCPACGMPLIPKEQTQTKTQAQNQTLKAAIFVFDGVQIIDFTGPMEVLGQAGIEAFTVAENETPIQTVMGLNVTPSLTFENMPKVDLMIIPGGNVDPHVQKQNVIQWIQKSANSAQYVLSVCNGAFYLAQAGLLDGRQATTFYDLIDELKSTYPKVNVLTNKRFVDNGKVLTTAGLSSGIDGTLYLVSKIRGKGFAQQVALNMEYNWQPDSGYARAALADKYLRRMMGRRLRMEVPKQVNARVIQTSGTSGQWKTEWELETTSDANEIRAFLESKLQELGKWSPDKQANAQNSKWNFRGDNGENWTGQLEIHPISGKQHFYHVTLQIQKT